MATESVDEILGKLARQSRIAYVRWEKNQELDGQAVEDELVKQAKAALDAYYTRECARKVLEGRIDTAQTALRACPTQDDKLRKWLEQHIVSIRAAIQEMEGK